MEKVRGPAKESPKKEKQVKDAMAPKRTPIVGDAQHLEP